VLDHLLALLVIVAVLGGGLVYLGGLDAADLLHLAHTARTALAALLVTL